jgi:UDP:flavonoid glycosyltransferase YjiC (YdhE family)
MATIVISSKGTHGDHLPYIALGEALQKKGHTVRMAFRQSMLPLVREAGLEGVVCGEDLLPEEARKKAVDWDEWQIHPDSNQDRFDNMKLYFEQDLPIIFQQLLQACEGADLLICGLQRQMFGAMIGQKIGLPWVCASVTPSFQCAQMGQYLSQQHIKITNLFLPTLKEVFHKLQIPEIDWFNYYHNPRSILASSRHFCSLDEQHSHFQQTGFWFYENPQWHNWQPDPALRHFVETEGKPLFLTFSSIPVVDPASVLNVHLQGAKKLGRKLIVQRGIANFNESLLKDDRDRQDVMFVDFMPQDWLLSNVDTIIHHGGIGTIARALRHNCPMIVEPLGNDQFFNAKRVLNLKIGTAVKPHALTADGLAHILETKVLTPEIKKSTEILGEKIRLENSLENACNLIESWL